MKPDVYRKESRTIEINGEPLIIDITIATMPDECATLEDYLGDECPIEEREKIIDDLDRGNLSIVGVIIGVESAFAPDVHGHDSLWNIGIRKESDIEEYAVGEGMIDNAIENFIEQMPKAIEKARKALAMLEVYAVKS